MAPMAPEFCSTTEAGATLGISVEQVRALVRVGVLRGGRPGGVGNYRVQIKSLDAFQGGRRK